jgi:hypothetical protein
MIIPNFVIVDDNGSTEATGRVDTSAGDGDGGQVHHEDSKSNRKRSKHLEIKITKKQ